VSSTIWLSSSSVGSKVCSGIFRAIEVRLSIDRQYGSASNLATFDAPAVSDVTSSFSPASGSVSVTVFGSSFALQSCSQRTVIGFSTAAVSKWVSDSSLLSKVSSGTFSAVRFVVSAGRQFGHGSRVFSYITLTILNVRGQNHPSSAATQLTVDGTSFGMADLSANSKFGQTSCESSLWVSDSSATGKVPSGVGFHLTVILSTSFAASALFNVSSYEAPSVMASSRTNGVSTGMQSITILGASFGFIGYSDKFRLEQSAFAASRYLSDTSVDVRFLLGFR
jgi:hypothetical protein